MIVILFVCNLKALASFRSRVHPADLPFAFRPVVNDRSTRILWVEYFIRNRKTNFESRHTHLQSQFQPQSGIEPLSQPELSHRVCCRVERR